MVNKNRQLFKKLNGLLSIWGKALLIEIAVFELLYVAGAIYFSNHFLMNSSINGVDVSLMSTKQAQQAIEEELGDYKLEIRVREGKPEYIRGTDIDLQFEIHGTTEGVMNQQLILFWFANSFNDKCYTLNSEVSYDSGKLDDAIDSLICMQEDNMIAPTEPQIVQTEEGFVVEEATKGKTLNKDEVERIIAEKLNDLMTYVDLEAELCYVEPRFHKDSSEVKAALEHLEAIREMEVTYRLGSQTEQLTGMEILEWVTIDDEFEVVVDQNAVEDFINELKDTYENLGLLMEFQTAGGDIVQLDSYVVEDEISIFDSQQLIEIIQTAKLGKNQYEWNSAKLATVGHTYIEVNLSTQHMYGYVDGVLVVQSDIISGKPENETQSGIYAIHTKISPKAVSDDEEDREAKYWLGFNGQFGIQDAKWQHVFGGSRYVTDGSDGCIWMPIDTAQEVYENFEVGDFVIIYGEDDIKEDTEEGNSDRIDNLTPSAPQNSSSSSSSNQTTTSQNSSATQSTSNSSNSTTADTDISSRTEATQATESTETTTEEPISSEDVTSSEESSSEQSDSSTEPSSSSETESDQPVLIE
ncbi:MAG: L,D-transpeptidase family protein [Lachnospiraceae bacterium]|nr:L,D-transpeptidase family protein [Lachnospiraceae bacterium]